MLLNRIQVWYWEASCKDIWTQKDRKFILIIGHIHHRSSSLSWLHQVSEGMLVMPNIAFITRFGSVRRHLGNCTPVRRKILKPTPTIFGVTQTKCTLAEWTSHKTDVHIKRFKSSYLWFAIDTCTYILRIFVCFFFQGSLNAVVTRRRQKM